MKNGLEQPLKTIIRPLNRTGAVRTAGRVTEKLANPVAASNYVMAIITCAVKSIVAGPSVTLESQAMVPG